MSCDETKEAYVGSTRSMTNRVVWSRSTNHKGELEDGEEWGCLLVNHKVREAWGFPQGATTLGEDMLGVAFDVWGMPL